MNDESVGGSGGPQGAWPQIMPGGGGERGGPEGRGFHAQSNGFARLKRSLRRMQAPISRIESALSRLQAAGYTAPQDIMDAFNNAKTALEVIKNAGEFSEETQDASQIYNDSMDLISDNMDSLQMLLQFSQIARRAHREIDKLNSKFDRIKARLANANMNLENIYGGIQAKINAVRADYDRADTEVKAGRPENAMDAITESFFPDLEEAYKSIGLIEAIRNFTRLARDIERGLNNAQSVISRLEENDVNVEALKAILARARTKFGEFRAILTQTDFDPEDVVEILNDLDEMKIEFEEKLDDLREEEGDNGIPRSPINFSGIRMPPMPPMPRMEGRMEGPGIEMPRGGRGPMF